MKMASGTLVTFLLQTPRTVKSVQLLGSWDNFSKPYPMERDRRLGSGHWRGCHSFTDIICDGTTVQPPDCKRDGALLEGGRYWYYYQLDDDIEIHDSTESSTTDCPFLPGQEVNILEVPVQIKERKGSLSSSSSAAFTLDPEDKFRAPKPPTPSACRRSPNSQDRPVTRYGSRPQSPVVEPGEAPHPCDKDHLGTTKSGRVALPDSVSICSEPPIPVVGWKSEQLLTRPHTTGSFPWGDYLTQNLYDELSSREVPTGQSLSSTRPGSGFIDSKREEMHDHDTVGSDGATTAVLESIAALNLGTHTPNEETIPTELDGSVLPGSSMAATAEPTSLPSRVSSVRIAQPDIQSHGNGLDESNHRTHDDNGPLTRADSFACSLQHTASTSSARTSGMWSSLTSGSFTNDQKRCSRLSQPLTPTMSAIGDVILEPTFENELEQSNSPIRRLDSGFLGYSLPEAEYSSALTIRNLETANSRTSGHGSDPYDGSQRKQYVEAWNDGNTHRTTALQELVDDLGYLGSMIV